MEEEARKRKERLAELRKRKLGANADDARTSAEAEK